MFAPEQDLDERPEDVGDKEGTEPQVGEPDDFTGSTEAIIESSAILPLNPQYMEEHSKDEGAPIESTTVEDNERLDKEEQGESLDLERAIDLNKEYQLTIENLQRAKTNLEEDNQFFEGQNEKLNKKTNDLRRENKSLREEMEDLKDHVSHLEDQKEELCDKIESLRKEQEQMEREKNKEIVKGLKTISELESQIKKTQKEQEEAQNTQTQGVNEPQTHSIKERREAEARFQRLLIESSTIEENIRRNVVKSKEEIKEMKSHLVKETVAYKGRQNAETALKSITEFQQSLHFFNCDIDCGIIPANQKQKERIDAEIKKQNLLKEAVEQTNRDMDNEAEDRNIRLIQMNHTDSKLLSSATPKFCGTGSLHIFMWLKIMDKYFKKIGVLPEDSAIILREHCIGKSRSIIDARFQNDANPSSSAIKKLLVDHFGNKDKILREILTEHNSLGHIPHPCNTSTYSSCHALSEAHLDLFQKAKLLTERTVYDGYNTVGARDLNLRSYSEALLGMLPPDYIRVFREEIRNKDLSTEDILAKLKNTLENIKITALENLQQFGESEEKGQKKITTANTFTAQSESFKCFICSHMDREFSMSPPNKQHATYINKNNMQMAKPESCGHISGLNIMEKRSFCDQFEICPVCLTCKEDGIHNRDTCKFTERVKTFKCRSTQCTERFSMCHHHQHLNDDALEKTRRLLQKDNCEFRW